MSLRVHQLGVRAAADFLERYDALFQVEVTLSALLSRFADLIICNSEAGCRHHAKLGYAARDMIMIPNGIDLERFEEVTASAFSRPPWICDVTELIPRGAKSTCPPIRSAINWPVFL